MTCININMNNIELHDSACTRHQSTQTLKFEKKNKNPVNYIGILFPTVKLVKLYVSINA